MTGMSRISQCVGEYQEWKPAYALRSHLSCIWQNDLSQAASEAYEVVPDACADILFTGQRLWIAGPDTRPIHERTEARHRVVGARFRPGAAYPWLGVPLSEIVNLRVPLEEFWGEEARSAEDRLCILADPGAVLGVLEGTLAGRLARVGPVDRQIACVRAHAAHGLNREAASSRQVSLAMGISERTLLRRCNDAFGYGFKTLERILRFQRLLRLVSRSAPPSLAVLAQETGFADQAHMSREVLRLAAITPTGLVAQVSRLAGRIVQDA